MGTRWKAAAAAVLLLSAAFLGGCGCMPEEPAPAAERYGVADMETLVKAHPLYSEYFRLETEYEGLVEKYRSEQQRLLHMDALQRKTAGALGDKAAEAEYKAKVKLKEDALNRKLKEEYEEMLARHAGEKARVTLEGGEDAETRIANLQLRLKVVGISGEEKAAAAAELKELLDSRYRNREEPQLTDEERRQLAEAREAARTELDDFAKKTAEEIRTRKENGAPGAGSLLPDPELWNKAWSENIKKKQMEMAAVKKQIEADIREKAAIIGQEKQLAMIFSSYRANIDAVDVTGEIVGELVQLPLAAKKADAGK